MRTHDRWNVRKPRSRSHPHTCSEYVFNILLRCFCPIYSIPGSLTNPDLQRRAQVFFWGHPLVFFKGLDKVAYIVKSAAHPDIRDGVVRGGKLEACLFDPIIIQIINGSTVRHLPEIPAEVFSVHPCRPGKVIQGDTVRVRIFYQFQRFF